MTRDEAIRVLKEYIALDKDIYNEYLEAQKVAIEALEEQQNPNSIRINFVGEEEAKEFNEYLKNQQESILDKIRAEIEELDEYYDNDYFSGNKDAMYKCNEVLQIIDKYRESEVEE